MPPFSAPLADPNAVPNEAVKVGVNVVLQIICAAMLQGADGTAQHEGAMMQVAQTMENQGGQPYIDGIVASLSYVRDRVGVPRDMKLPAARLLRAHLNWAIEKLLTFQGQTK
jgi:glutathione S-transferase